MENLFSFDGRVGRQAVWICGFVSTSMIVILTFLLSALATAEQTGEPTAGLTAAIVIGALASLIVGISALSFQVRRWHDLDKSGWWVLISLVPILGALYAFGMLGFVPGTEGSNSFGAIQTSGTKVQSGGYKGGMSARRAAEIERKTVV